MANDCSERICQFGLAHVDTPKGDLDSSSGKLSGPGTNSISELVVVGDAMYPRGTWEQFPNMKDSDNTILTNSAHYYSECSNKGICDRASGDCKCFEGYGGSACQRATCPVTGGLTCSGHGTCETIKELAAQDNNNIYNLWDEYSTMGCNCDAGFSGPDCSEKECKYGFDPLYYDDEQNVRFANWTIQIYTAKQTGNQPFADQIVIGNYSLIFYDSHGEDWETGPIDINARCDDITNALEALPNNVIPDGSVWCYNEAAGNKLDANTGNPGATATATQPTYTAYPSWAMDESVKVHNKYTLAFSENPGRLRQIKINKYLDGNRPTLFSLEPSSDLSSTLGWHIYANGFTGDYVDYVNDLCEDVFISPGPAPATPSMYQSYHTLTAWDYKGTTSKQIEFKTCLGGADKVDESTATSNNYEIYDWDYGTPRNPHLVKLVDATYVTVNRQLSQAQYGDTATSASFRKSNTGTAISASWRDDADYHYPISQLCPNEVNGRDNGVQGTIAANKNVMDPTWCRRENPPGFYVVLFYIGDAGNDVAGTFYTFNNFGLVGGYTLSGTSATGSIRPAMFYVFTTKGIMEEVNSHLSVFNVDETASSWNVLAKTRRAHTNVLHTFKHDASAVVEDMSCEVFGFNPTIQNLANDCINKGDMVFVINKWADTVESAATPNRLATSNPNPLYLNMYRVEKIYRADPNNIDKDYTLNGVSGTTNDPLTKAESTRNQIILDYGMNAKYVYDSGSAVVAAAKATHFGQKRGTSGDALLDQYAVTTHGGIYAATLYKFIPPTQEAMLASRVPNARSYQGGYEYSAQCSNRGSCDTTSGLCACYHGYTGDACQWQDALSSK